MNHLESSMYPSFSGLVKYRLVIRFSMSTIDISVNTYHCPLVVTGLSHSGWYLQVPSIFLQIPGVHPPTHRVVFHFVNVLHLLCPIFRSLPFACIQPRPASCQVESQCLLQGSTEVSDPIFSVICPPSLMPCVLGQHHTAGLAPSVSLGILFLAGYTELKFCPKCKLA